MVGRRRLTAPERRRAILDAAQEVFGERGYHGSSLDEIAQSAGISKALIYEHFESKKELHESLLTQYAGELFERFRANAARAETGEERLRTGVAVFFGFVEEHREAWRVLFRDAADPELAPVIRAVQDQATGAIVALVNEDPTHPEPGPGETREDWDEAIEMFATQLSGTCQALANWWHDHQEVPRERLVDRVVEFCWLGLDRVRAGERAGDPRRVQG
jgi:AcrR family transcriptional regulator